MAIHEAFTAAVGSGVDVEALEAVVRGIVPGAVIGRVPLPADPTDEAAGVRWLVKCASRPADQSLTGPELAALRAAFASAAAITSQRSVELEIDRMSAALKATILALLDQVNVLRSQAGMLTLTRLQFLALVRAKSGGDR